MPTLSTAEKTLWFGAGRCGRSWCYRYDARVAQSAGRRPVLEAEEPEGWGEGRGAAAGLALGQPEAP